MEAVLLSGDHPSLPHAELRTLLDVHGGRLGPPVTARVATTEEGTPALERHVQSWAWGDLWGQAPDDADGIEVLADAVRAHATGEGTAAVRAVRYGLDKRGHRARAERALGQALADAGHSIDLSSPDVEVFAWLGDGRIATGLLRGTRPPGFGDRAVERRAHFSPISLHPRRAASLVHLARVPPGGRVYDPFCGTGGIVLEAALLGFDAWGSDRDPFMVQGTWQTLTDAGTQPLDATVFEADIGRAPELVEDVQGIVTDLPYGTASSTHDEDIAALYHRAFDAFAAILPSGGHAVIGHRDAALLEPVADAGFEPVEAHEEFVHKNLTRRYAVLRRA